jgi:hypothetical protein
MQSTSRLQTSCVVALLTVAFGLLITRPIRAQDEADEPPKEAPKTAGTPQTEVMKDNLTWYIRRPPEETYGFPCLLLVVIGLALLILALLVNLRRDQAIPPSLVTQLAEAVKHNDRVGVLEHCRSDPSFLGQVLFASVSRLHYGIEEARIAGHNRTQVIEARKAKWLGCLQVFICLAPLLGFAVTIYRLCYGLARMARSTPLSDLTSTEWVPSGVADLASHALVWLFFGVILSGIAVAFYLPFKNRLHRLAVEVGCVADDLLAQIYYKEASGSSPTAIQNATTLSRIRC